MSQYHCNIFGAINSSLTYMSWEHLRLVTFAIQSQRVLTFTLLLLALITPKCLHPENLSTRLTGWRKAIILALGVETARLSSKPA